MILRLVFSVKAAKFKSAEQSRQRSSCYRVRAGQRKPTQAAGFSSQPSGQQLLTPRRQDQRSSGNVMCQGCKPAIRLKTKLVLSTLRCAWQTKRAPAAAALRVRHGRGEPHNTLRPTWGPAARGRPQRQTRARQASSCR